MRNTITLFKSQGCWMAEYSGPYAQELLDAFGSAVVPTPFMARAKSEDVVREISWRNPGFIIEVRSAHA